jgi:hypothetical protein
LSGAGVFYRAAKTQRWLAGDAPPENTLKGVRDRAILATCFITASAARSCAG